MFIVRNTYGNGYRCCCHQSWEYPDNGIRVERLGDALAAVPKHINARHRHPDVPLEGVSVIDESTLAEFGIPG